MESAPSVKPDREERQENWLSAGDVRPDADLPAHVPPRNVIIDDGEGMRWSYRRHSYGCREDSFSGYNTLYWRINSPNRGNSREGW